MRKRTLFWGFCFFLILYFGWLDGPSFGQRVTGKVVGKVTDEEGTPLPGVAVEISSPSLMGGPRSQITTENGSCLQKEYL